MHMDRDRQTRPRMYSTVSKVHSFLGDVEFDSEHMDVSVERCDWLFRVSVKGLLW